MDTDDGVTEYANAARKNPRVFCGSSVESDDLKAGLRKIAQDLREYYVLTYTSTNPSFDGKFRTIAVKVSRPELIVGARTGYYAFRSRDSLPLLGFEAQLIATLEFLQNNRPVIQAGGKLPAADSNGRVQYVTTFGLEIFQPGDYALRVTVHDGQNSAFTQSSFRVEP